MQSGIFTAYFPEGLEETARKIRSHGFNTVQLDLHFKDIDLSAGQIRPSLASQTPHRLHHGRWAHKAPPRGGQFHQPRPAGCLAPLPHQADGSGTETGAGHHHQVAGCPGWPRLIAGKSMSSGSTGGPPSGSSPIARTRPPETPATRDGWARSPSSPGCLWWPQSQSRNGAATSDSPSREPARPTPETQAE